MYLQGGHTYYSSSGQQMATRGEFLLLLQLRDQELNKDNLYAIVRKVALQQCGHWMMGSANIGGEWKTVSGSYGHDGLPMTVDSLPKDAIKVPEELYDLWNNGGGHNSAGSEREAMRTWAKDVFNVRDAWGWR